MEDELITTISGAGAKTGHATAERSVKDYLDSTWDIGGQTGYFATAESEFAYEHKGKWLVDTITIATPNPTVHRIAAGALEVFGYEDDMHQALMGEGETTPEGCVSHQCGLIQAMIETAKDMPEPAKEDGMPKSKREAAAWATDIMNHARLGGYREIRAGLTTMEGRKAGREPWIKGKREAESGVWAYNLGGLE